MDFLLRAKNKCQPQVAPPRRSAAHCARLPSSVKNGLLHQVVERESESKGLVHTCVGIFKNTVSQPPFQTGVNT